MIANLCLLAPPRRNVGDCLTHPVDYFNWGFKSQKYALGSPASSYLRTRPSVVIVGGGGIVRHPTRNDWLAMCRIAAELPIDIPMVVWGMGLNDHGRLDIAYDSELEFIERRPNVLVGLRDRFHRNYLPCVSCMRPEFDERFTIVRDIGLYVHESYDLALDYPKMSNAFVDDPEQHFRDVVSFLGSSELVITNSYHGAYWATLLGTRVIVANPFSNKFLGFKFEPLIVQDVRYIEHHLPYLRRSCRRYDGVP